MKFYTVCNTVFSRSNWKILHLASFYYTPSGCDGTDKYEVWLGIAFIASDHHFSTTSGSNISRWIIIHNASCFITQLKQLATGLDYEIKPKTKVIRKTWKCLIFKTFLQDMLFGGYGCEVSLGNCFCSLTWIIFFVGTVNLKHSSQQTKKIKYRISQSLFISRRGHCCKEKQIWPFGANSIVC